MKLETNPIPRPLQSAAQDLLIATSALLSSTSLPAAEAPRPERPEIQFVQMAAPKEDGGLGGLGKKPGPIPKPEKGDVASDWLLEFDKRVGDKPTGAAGREIKTFAEMVRDPEAFKLIKEGSKELLKHLDPKDEKDLKGAQRENDTIKILKRIADTTDPKDLLKTEATAKSALSGLKRGTNVYLLRYGPNAEKEAEK